jgi:hypothetical protein
MKGFAKAAGLQGESSMMGPLSANVNLNQIGDRVNETAF